jgi:uncharacterized repeat protein (TIGR03943 family)
VTQGIVMLLLGGAVARIVWQGGHLNYVKPSLTIPLLLAAAVLAAVGVAEIWHSRPRAEVAAGSQAGPGASHEGDPDPGEPAHDHSHGPRVAWLLLIPLFALYLIPPAALGADAAERSGTLVPQATEAFYPPLDAGDPAELSLIEYSNRAVFDQGATLDGREVALTGFVTQRPEEGWYVTRMAIACCAADALAVKVVVTGDDPGVWPDDTWVTVVGRFVEQGDRQGDEPEGLATIEVDSVKLTEEPADPYEGQVF